jgi:hypothetical protein
MYLLCKFNHSFVLQVLVLAQEHEKQRKNISSTKHTLAPF